MQKNLRGPDFVRRFKAYGLPCHLTRPLAAEIIKWQTNSGPAWAVSRLKSLKIDMIRIRGGLEPISWVRKNRKGDWYGVWGALRNYASKSDRCFKTVINCLMAYSVFIPESPTEEHVRKFRTAVSAREEFIPPQLLDDIVQHTHRLGISVKSRRLSSLPRLIDFAGSPSVKSPVMGGPSVPQNDSHEKELLWFEDPIHMGFSRVKHWPIYSAILAGIDRKELESISPISGKWYFPYEGRAPVPLDKEPLAGNVVPLTKDGGWKVRWIASPFRVHQLALAGVGDAVFNLLRSLNWDCTFDQQKAIPHIQEHLAKGHTAFAVDLSSATDYFPLQLQLSVLYSLSDDPRWKLQVDLFRDLSRARWRSPYGEIRWTKGQPMGLYPSFAAFALTHGLLLSLLSTKARSFWVLGDDVVILDAHLYDKYMKVLGVLGCPHSPDKSLISDKVTEFAGKIITPSEVIDQFKWRSVSDDSFLDMMRAFGPRFMNHLTPPQKRVYQEVARLLPPWGCNHSLGDSLPLNEVVELTDDFESKLEGLQARKYDVSFLGRLVRILKPDKPDSLFHKLRSYEVRNQAADFDEKSVDTFRGSVFENLPGDKTAVTDTLEFTGRKVRLPGAIPNKVLCRRTVLQTLEDYLALQANA